MRDHRGDGSSRLDQRKSRTDRLLNWTIGIVSLLILAVGCIILISIFTASSPERSAAQSTQTSHSQSHKSSTASSTAAKDSSEVSNDQSSSFSSDSSESSETADDNHQASYDKGSADWDAQVQAIAKATGIDQSQMTILWLGNGGSPNSSLARVAPKSASGSVYVVHLIYQNGKWQADNVRKPGE